MDTKHGTCSIRCEADYILFIRDIVVREESDDFILQVIRYRFRYIK